MAEPNPQQQLTFPLDPASVQILITALKPYFTASLVQQIVAGVAISVSPSSGQGIVTVTNAGVASLIAGAGISISGSTGNITISATSGGVTQIIAGAGISISPVGGTGAVTISATGSAGSFSATTGTNFQSLAAASATVTIAHGLGKAPTLVFVNAYVARSTGVQLVGSNGTFTAAATTCTSFWYVPSSGGVAAVGGNIITALFGGTDGQTATLTVDATNLYFAFTKSGAPAADTLSYNWTAMA